jgi:nitroreductase
MANHSNTDLTLKLYDAIFKRRSIRKYSSTPVDERMLHAIRDFAANTAEHLYPDIRIATDIVGRSEVSKLGTPNAPCFLVLYSEATADNSYLLNGGFFLQQLDLYLYTLGLGRCWLGMAKPRQKNREGLPHLITLAFGYPQSADALSRSLDDFKRKSLEQITSGSDPRLEAARLAPSGNNMQRWYFAAHNGSIDVFRNMSGRLTLKLYADMGLIDIGIALCHLRIASQYYQLPFDYRTLPARTAPSIDGYEYLATV